MKHRIIPAILTDDFEDALNKIRIASEFAQTIQIDVMDGSFVQNNSFQLSELVEYQFNIDFEIHLMVENPTDYFNVCADIHAKRVLVHIETLKNPQDLLTISKNYDFEIYFAINPDTDFQKIKDYVTIVDGVLCMGVNPGFQRQEFQEDVFDHIKEIRAISKDIMIEVDGSVNSGTIERLNNAGVNLFAVGSAIFNNGNPKNNFENLLALIN